MSVLKFKPPALDPLAFITEASEMPEFRRMIAAKDAEKAKERLALATELAAAEADHAAKAPELAKRVAATTRALAAAETALQAARAAYAKAHSEEYGANMALQALKYRLEGELRTTADLDAIVSFRSWTLDEIDRTRKSFDFSSSQIRHPITGRATVKTVNNKASVAARIAAINQAWETAEQMVLEADQSTVRRRLVALADGLPVVEKVE